LQLILHFRRRYKQDGSFNIKKYRHNESRWLPAIFQSQPRHPIRLLLDAGCSVDSDFKQSHASVSTVPATLVGEGSRRSPGARQAARACHR
jgi:hypothetical protein